MPPVLEPMDRDLLNFLCICADKKIRVTCVKSVRRAALRRLRYAGLVGFDDFQPSPSALASWREREVGKTVSKIPGDMCAAEDPPLPKAGEDGGAAAARSGDELAVVSAAPPKRKPHLSMAEKAERFESKPRKTRTRGRKKNSSKARPLRLAKAPAGTPANESEAVAATPVAPPRPPLSQPNTDGASGAHGEGPEPRPEGGLANGPDQQRKSRTPDTAASTYPEGASEPAREALSVPLLGGTEAADHGKGMPAARRIEDRAPHDEPAAVRNCPPPSPAHQSTGAELARKLQDLAKKKGWPIGRLGQYLFGGPSGVTVLSRRTQKIHQSTIDKIEAFLANPPDELPKRNDYTPRPREPRPEGGGARAVAAGFRVQTAKARKWLDAGKPIDAAPPGLRKSLYEEQRRREEVSRLGDPIEQAKRILQRRYAPVCSAETVDGPKGKFIVGRKIVSKSELLEMAGIAA